jgi:tRNA/rRNA methyltransferase
VPATPAPTVILVAPQLGENIGMVARAMANFGLSELRLVNPRDGWPSETARAAASGANAVIDGAAVFSATREAIADLGLVLATTARPREMAKPVLDPRAAAIRLATRVDAGEKAGILFGGERTGLENDDVAFAEAAITFPTNPAFASLNLAQSVLLMGYEWFQTRGLEGGRPRQPPPPLATKDDMQRLFEHLEGELDAAGFLFPPDKRPHMVRNLRTIFLKAELTDQEVRSLRGVVKALAELKKRRKAGSG